MSAQSFITDLLSEAEVIVDGPNPWDPQIHDPRLWDRVFMQGSLGLGEAYMDGWWDCDDLSELFCRMLNIDIESRFRITPTLLWQLAQARVFNMQNIRRSKRVADMHYSQTDAYKATLDHRMTGSCAYWQNADNLDEAQEAKLDLICRKLGLKRGDRVLDIGCGWGSFMGFAAEKYGASCLGVTVSADQANYARERYKGLDLDFQVKDYRELDATVDHIVSVGMFEHVGYRNHRAYFETARRAIKEDGLFLLHTIGSNETRTTTDPWIEKYIFPGGVLPSIAQIGEGVENLFSIVDLHNIGPHYDKTLMAWHDNFERNWPAPNSPDQRRFYRMWRYYLLSCAGAFRSGGLQVWQIVLSTKGVPHNYETIR